MERPWGQEDRMSIWGKVIGGVVGFYLGGPLGGILGAVAGHVVDRSRTRSRDQPKDSLETRQTAFTVAVIVLGAKMAKADGRVTRDEVDAFKQVFQIPPDEMGDVGRLFNEAKREASGFEPYAAQIGRMFAADRAVLEELLGGLFHIAKADGQVQASELDYLAKVAHEFGFDARSFERIRASHLSPHEADPYQVLGLSRGAGKAEVKKAYRALIRENHPDTLIAKGMPQEFIDLANQKMAAINAAHERIERERSKR